MKLRNRVMSIPFLVAMAVFHDRGLRQQQCTTTAPGRSDENCHRCIHLWLSAGHF